MSAKRHLARFPFAVLALVVAFAATFAACGGSDDANTATATARPAAATLLSPKAYRDALAANPGAFVVNVHTPYEGEIAGTSAFVPFDRVTELAATLPADKSAPLYIYCRSGRMSADAMPALQALGYTKVIDLKGGMNAWRDAGLEIVTKPGS